MRSSTLHQAILMAFSISFLSNPLPTGPHGPVPPSLIVEVGQITVPEGYKRHPYTANSFAAWLRKLPLRRSTRVYLYNGREKGNQTAQFAVLDLSIGNKNLQQCADVCMRLRADYLLAIGKENEIVFFDNASTSYRYSDYRNKISYASYLEKVFNWCGTLSLTKQMKKVERADDIAPGDVIIQGGSPGHAVMIIDVAVNKKGEKLYMLAQGYMPAQDIHILKNEINSGPWYSLSNSDYLKTPEWTFRPLQVKTWD